MGADEVSGGHWQLLTAICDKDDGLTFCDLLIRNKLSASI
jgi:hypothetical protein